MMTTTSITIINRINSNHVVVEYLLFQIDEKEAGRDKNATSSGGGIGSLQSRLDRGVMI